MAKELFERIDRKIGDILVDIRSGRIGLPDLQRPFVWKDIKVRDLIDSMMKGFPVGYVMLWSAPEDYQKAGNIGKGTKQYSRPSDLVIDGQQRLTSLLAALMGETVKDKDFKERKIRLAYHPLENRFEVWTPAFENDNNWINDISRVFAADEEHILSKYLRKLFRQINDGRERKFMPPLSEDEEDAIDENIHNLLSLRDYILPTLRIKSYADEEQVAEIFKRVNSGGQNLNENNFIETLLAVYDNDVHTKIVDFCSASRIPANKTSYNGIIHLNTSHIIRMTVGYGFRRARLTYAYKILRGKDLESGVVSDEIRETNIRKFKEALAVVTDLNNWHSFFNLFYEAGYLKSSLISSNYVPVYSYVLYLIGKYYYRVSSAELRRIMTLWIFMTTVTKYYTSSSAETTVERIFADLRNIKTPNGLVAYLSNEIENALNDDFFRVTLVDNLNSSAAVSPAWYAYIASLNVLGTQLLFSSTPASKYWLAGTHGTKSSIDKHHIFPKNYLRKIGIYSDRDRNQIANFTYLDYGTNIDISDNPPAKYVEKYRCLLGEEAYRRSCQENALPENWDKLEYFDFLAQRRKLMAQIIKKAYLKLKARTYPFG